MRYYLLFILTCFTCCCYAINPFELKGKYVIFSPSGSISDLDQYNNVYNNKTLKGKGFKDSNLSSIKPYGKKIFVEDVQVSKKPKDFPFLYFVCKLDEERFTIAYRLNKKEKIEKTQKIGVPSNVGYRDTMFFEVDTKIEPRSVWHLGKGTFIEVDYVDLTDICIEAYTVDYLDSLETVLQQTRKYALIQFGGYYGVNTHFFTNSYGKTRFVSSLSTPLTFVKFDYALEDTYHDENPIFNRVFYEGITRLKQNTLCAVYTDGNDLFYLYLNAALNKNILIDEDEYLKACRERYADYELEQFLQSYQGKEIHMKLDKSEYSHIWGSKRECDGKYVGGYDYKEDNCLKLEDIVLKPLSHKDSIYFNMYYQFVDVYGTEEQKQEKIYIPVSKNWKNEFELRTDYLERVRLDRLAEEEASLRREKELAQEEAEYRSSLIKKFGRNNAQLIMDGEVRVGFTKAMCEESWGSPIHINRTTTAYGTLEQWVYGIGCYLYFEGNKLTGIQN